MGRAMSRRPYSRQASSRRKAPWAPPLALLDLDLKAGFLERALCFFLGLSYHIGFLDEAVLGALGDHNADLCALICLALCLRALTYNKILFYVVAVFGGYLAELEAGIFEGILRFVYGHARDVRHDDRGGFVFLLLTPACGKG